MSDEPTAVVGARRRFHEPLTVLPGIGPGSAQKLARLRLATVGDLILHLPFRYEDRTRSVPFDELAPGQECLVTGQVLEAQLAYGRRRSLTARIGDGRGALTARFFHFAPSQRQALRPGLWMRCFGEVRSGPTIRAAEHGHQTVVMAPTEILAEQHFETGVLRPSAVDRRRVPAQTGLQAPPGNNTLALCRYRPRRQSSARPMRQGSKDWITGSRSGLLHAALAVQLLLEQLGRRGKER